MRAWFLKSKDRQLHTAVTAYIAAYFSPPLIASALQPLRALSADSELKADGWSLRIGGGTEALLAYTVDEQSLEIALRLPGEWPLKGAEAREVRRVGGIPENKWRAWLFGLQQVAGGAGVLEGLLHFRKNVAGHFAGQVECAICYWCVRIPSVHNSLRPCVCRSSTTPSTSRTLTRCMQHHQRHGPVAAHEAVSDMQEPVPRELPVQGPSSPGRASCADAPQWFKSSHASTCPLCRSDIL